MLHIRPVMLVSLVAGIVATSDSVGLLSRALAQVKSADASASLAADSAESLRRQRDALMRVLGEMPARPGGTSKTLESVKLATGWRHKIEYLAELADPLFNEPSDTIRAYLFIPDHKPSERLPAILAIHQDGPSTHLGKAEPAGLAGANDQWYGVELFERGYVVLCPDRFGHAERRRVTPNDLSSIDAKRDEQLINHRVGQLLLKGRTFVGKEVYDLMRSTDILCSLPDVDVQRIGAIGHSAGGFILVHFLFADERIKAGVSSCGLFEMIRFYDERAPKRRTAALALPGLAKAGRSADFLAFVAPRPVMLTRGMWEWGNDDRWGRVSRAHVAETRDMERRARVRYAAKAADGNLRVIYFDEAGGNHAFPPGVKRQACGQKSENLDAFCNLT
jgi:dienelactone hydrolase